MKKLFAHFCLSRSGSNCLFSAIVKEVSGIITREIRFNKLRLNLEYSNCIFTKIRRFPELTLLGLKPSKCIFSFRKDKIKQAISHYIVDTCGVDTTRKEHINKKDLDVIHSKIKINKNEFLTYMDNCIPSIQKIEKDYLKYFIINKIPYKAIPYETLMSDYQNTVKMCINFLFGITIEHHIECYTHCAYSEINDILLEIYKKERE